LKTFQSIQGYFIADHRMLHYIQLNRDLWDKASVVAKLGALDLNGHIADMKLNDVQVRFIQDDVKRGISCQDLKVFNILCNDLPYIRMVRYVVSYMLCAHDPHFFPIWDDRRKCISEWIEQGEVTTYEQLKQKVDLCKSENGCEEMSYYMFNKLLWLCE